MKTFLVVCVCTFFSVMAYSQDIDPKATVAGISNGFVTIEKLLNEEKIVSIQQDLHIVSFTMSYPVGEDDVVELNSNSDKLTNEMKEHIKNLKRGTALSFENIKAKKEDKTILIEAINLIIK